MKKIKYFLHICLFMCLGNSFVSCNDFFEFPQTSSFTEDSIFVRYDYTEKLLYQMYFRSPDLFLSTGWEGYLNGPNLDAATDGASAFSGQSKYTTHKFNFGGLNSTNVTQVKTGEYFYDHPWKSIRIAFTLIDRVNEVPDATLEQKQRIIAEAKVMIATRYFEMFKRFGGVPLVKKRLVDGSEFKMSRSTVNETVNYIVQLLDEAIASDYLPARVPTSLEFGRYTKAYAYGLKARTLLFAASPLFNTGTPYMTLAGHNDLICYGNSDPERWSKALTAAKDAIAYCEANGYNIVNNQEDNKTNYIVATQKNPRDGNSELIMGKMQVFAGDVQLFMLTRGVPFSGYAANSPTHNQVKRYRNADGTIANWTTEMTTPVDDPTAPYINLEPRFHASIGYNGVQWYPTLKLEFFNSFDPNTFPHGNNSKSKAKQEFAYALRKYVNGYEDVRISKAPWAVVCPYMRLAEMYMIVAEATNEYQKEAGLNEAKAALNKVLDRSGMDVPTSINTYQKMKEFIQNERAIEFYFENHRFFDAKRWLEGPALEGKIFNVDITKNDDLTYHYKEYVQEVRIWNNHYYLHPFPESEVNKQYGLIQNPGW